MKKHFTVILFLWLSSQSSFSQSTETDTTIHNFDEVIISANRIKEQKRNVAQQVYILNENEIQNYQAATAADLLINTGQVFIQKSQLGGGSPVLRGFEANRVLLVIDGVRMNNLIYRGGHLQNVITLDNNMLERTEVLFGPSSTVYGSDALGGVIHFYTRQPEFAVADKKQNLKVNMATRYGDLQQQTHHLALNVGFKKWASLTSFTFSDFADLVGGKNQNPFFTASYGERPFYVVRINDTDSMVMNPNKYKQVQSGYSQYDAIQKLAFRQNEHVLHQINLQLSTTTNVPRYDRLTEIGSSGPGFAQWYYGPQLRTLGAYDLTINNSNSFFEFLHGNLNFQHVEESRHTRRFRNNNLTSRIEKVNVAGLNLDALKTISSHSIRLGIDAQYNMLTSTAEQKNIASGEIRPASTRYPDGDNSMSNAAFYASHTWKVNERLTVTDGLRGGYVMLHSTFKDTTFYKLPYSEAKQNNFVYSGTVGLIHTPSNQLKLSALFSTGFRVPNVDDLSKVFETTKGNVIVPNTNLKPEKTYTYELGVTRMFGNHSTWENSVYYTDLNDAIITDKFKFNGQDSIDYDGVQSAVFANQNKQRAYIYGFSSQYKTQCTEYLYFTTSLNYTYGRIKTDSSDYPMDHIPPLLLRLELNYAVKKFQSTFFVNYNGWKRLKDYNLNGEDNQQYATPEGMPAWFTLNIHTSYRCHKYVTCEAGIDNLLDMQYRHFASGINAPGRNIYAALRIHFKN